MSAVPVEYLERKFEDAYALMLRKNLVKKGVERAMRAAYDEQVDPAAFAESLDHAIELEIEQRVRGRFIAALGAAEAGWEPPRVTATVEFLVPGASGEWERAGEAECDLGGYVGRLPLSELREMADDWGRFAEPVAEDLVMGGYVEGPAVWDLAVCRRPEGLDDYIGEIGPAWE